MIGIDHCRCVGWLLTSVCLNDVTIGLVKQTTSEQTVIVIGGVGFTARTTKYSTNRYRSGDDDADDDDNQNDSPGGKR
jgi:hypothetical protein